MLVEHFSGCKYNCIVCQWCEFSHYVGIVAGQVDKVNQGEKSLSLKGEWTRWTQVVMFQISRGVGLDMLCLSWKMICGDHVRWGNKLEIEIWLYIPYQLFVLIV